MQVISFLNKDLGYLSYLSLQILIKFGELKKDDLDKEGHKISLCQIVCATQRSSRKFLLAHQHSKSAQLNDRQLLLEKTVKSGHFADLDEQAGPNPPCRLSPSQEQQSGSGQAKQVSGSFRNCVKPVLGCVSHVCLCEVSPSVAEK